MAIGATEVDGEGSCGAPALPPFGMTTLVSFPQVMRTPQKVAKLKDTEVALI